MENKIILTLENIVGKEHVYTDQVDLFCYTYDASFSAEKPQFPGVVVAPGSTKEVSEILKVADAHNIAVIARGAGSNQSGGSVATKDCIILQMTRMNQILEIDARNMLAVVQPGVVNGNLQKELAKLGLFYPPDPASLEFSTLGGNVAECAGGPRGVKYGVTKDYVMALEVVLADGSIIRTGSKALKCVAGYDMTKLFTGSEGTLGIITEITLRLLPQPPARQTLMASFNHISQTAEAVVEIMAKGIIPACLELLDNVYVRNIESYKPCGLSLDADALLLIDVDGIASSLDEQINAIKAICEGLGAKDIRIATSPEEIDNIWTARRSAFGSLARNFANIISEDIAVPRDKIPAAVAGVRELGAKHNLETCVLGHAGDGNLHVNFLFREDNPEDVARGEAALPELFDLAISLGGTIAGEHGIGSMKAPFLVSEVSEKGMQIQQSIKTALDPKGILNPHKMFGDRSW